MSRVPPELSTAEQQWQEILHDFDNVSEDFMRCNDWHPQSVTIGVSPANTANSAPGSVISARTAEGSPTGSRIELLRQRLSEFFYHHYRTAPRGGTPESPEDPDEGLEFIREQLRELLHRSYRSRMLAREGITEDRLRQRPRELFTRPRAIVRSNTADYDQDQRPNHRRSGCCQCLQKLTEWLLG
jgi:hypothetical protein